MFRKLANSGQNAANVAKRHATEAGCCNDGSVASCEYEVVVPTSANIVAFTYKNAAGASVTYTFASAISGSDAVKLAAVKAQIVAIGYEDDGEWMAGIVQEVSGSNTVWNITGELEIVSMTHGTNTVVAATKKCKKYNLCTHTITYTGGTATLYDDLDTATINGLTYGTSTPTQVKTEFETELTALGVPYEGVTATDNSSNGWVVTVKAPSTRRLKLASTAFTVSGCANGFLA